MTTAVTRIQLKYSTGTAAPTSLATAEPAYSYASNTFFIGSPDGNGTIAIGGKFYLDQQQTIYDTANAAFSAANNATDTYVRNHANAAFNQANSAVAVNLTQNNSITAAFNTGNSAFAQANAAYAAANVNTGVNVTQNNSITFASDTANAAYANANSYITRNEAVNVSQNNRIDAAYTRANNSLSANNGGTVTGDVSITGNLYVTGNVVSISTTEIVANDSLIVLGLGNYTSDIVDIGFAGHYNDGTNAHSGIIRDSTNKEYYVFDGYTPEIGANNNVDPAHASFHIATVNANLKSQSVRVKNIDLLPYANGIYDTANAAFVRANNSLNANTGGSVTGNISVGGTITPNADVTWNLGSATNRWHSLFVGAGTIDIGGLTIKNTSVNGADTAQIGGVQDFKLSDAAVGSFRQLTNTANAAFNSANAAYANANSYITYAEAVNVTQNNSIAAVFASANAINGVDVTQNNSITVALNTANAAFASANAINGVDVTQNNRITVASDTANAAFANANSYIIYNDAVNATQNTNITDAQNSATAAFAAANGAVAVNTTQNNSITIALNTANAAFIAANNASDTWVRNQANAAFIQANAAFAAANSGTSAQYAYNQANAAFDKANSAYTNAGNAQSTADNAASAATAAQYTGTAAFNQANAAFAQANTYATASASVFNGTGDGTTKSFNLGYTPVSDGSASVVTIDGLVQYEGTYTVTTANSSINFVDAPASGEHIRVLAYTSVNPYVLGATGVTAGTYGGANTIGVFTTAANGQLTFASNTAIAIGADQITSGTLGVTRGGTGAGTFTVNGVLIGQGTSAFTTASSSTEGHVLTINSSGVPVFSYINGGTF